MKMQSNPHICLKLHEIIINKEIFTNRKFKKYYDARKNIITKPTIGWRFTKLLTQIRKIFVTLGPKISRLFKLKVLFEAEII